MKESRGHYRGSRGKEKYSHASNFRNSKSPLHDDDDDDDNRLDSFFFFFFFFILTPRAIYTRCWWWWCPTRFTHIKYRRNEWDCCTPTCVHTTPMRPFFPPPPPPTVAVFSHFSSSHCILLAVSSFLFLIFLRRLKCDCEARVKKHESSRKSFSLHLFYFFESQ